MAAKVINQGTTEDGLAKLVEGDVVEVVGVLFREQRYTGRVIFSKKGPSFQVGVISRDSKSKITERIYFPTASGIKEANGVLTHQKGRELYEETDNYLKEVNL